MSEITCLIPEEIMDGYYVFNTRVEYSDLRNYCRHGYAISSGDAKRTCDHNEAWTGIPVTCKSEYSLALYYRLYHCSICKFL